MSHEGYIKQHRRRGRKEEIPEMQPLAEALLTCGDKIEPKELTTCKNGCNAPHIQRGYKSIRECEACYKKRLKAYRDKKREEKRRVQI